MSIKNSRIFGLSVSLSLADIPDTKLALKNLELEKNDLEVIRGISVSGFDKNDLQSLSNISVPIWQSFDRYINDVLTYRSTLSLSGGSDFQLRGNLKIAGGISATAFRYPVLDLTPVTLNPSNNPVLKWGDISTSRVSSWSTFGSTILYGADVEIGGTLSVGKIKTRTVAKPTKFSAETATHKIKIEVDGATKYIYAMKGIPLRFKGYFRNFDAIVDFANPTFGVDKVSWRIDRTDGLGTEDFEDFIGENGSSTRSRLQYQSPFAAERFIEIYFPPIGIKTLNLNNINIQEIPKVVLNNLDSLFLSGNGLVDFPDINFIAPNLENLDISNNDFFNASIKAERKLNNFITVKLPSSTLRSLNIRGCFFGGIEQGIFVPFQELRTLRLDTSRGKYFYPDSSNTAGELPLFYGGSGNTDHKLTTLSARDNNFKSLGTTNLTTTPHEVNVENLNSLVNLDLYNNSNLIGTCNISSPDIKSINIGRTKLQCPTTLQNAVNLETFSAVLNSNFGSLFFGSSEATYAFSGCNKLISLNLDRSSVSGYIPLFNNASLRNIDLLGCNNLIAGRPGESGTARCLYNRTFENSPNISFFRLSVNNTNFAGEIEPNTFVPLQNSLTYLDLFSNGRFTGDFPDLESLTKLTKINSSSQNWGQGSSASLPSFASASLIEEIRLANNSFTGSISYSNKTSLNYLNVSNNKLQSISNTFNLPKLKSFFASNNEFFGPLPNLYNSCPIVEKVSLNDNQFTDYSRGNGLQSLERIKVIDLASNALTSESIDNILFDLYDNYIDFPRSNVVVNLSGGLQGSPSGYPTIPGIVNGLGNISQPSVSGGDVTSVGNDIKNLDTSGLSPVEKTYSNIIFNTDNSGNGFIGTINVIADITNGVITSIGTPTVSDTTKNYTGGNFTDPSGNAEVNITVDVNNSVTNATLITAGSGYSPGDNIVISQSYQDGEGNTINVTITVPVTGVKEKYYNSASYSVQINSGESGYAVTDTLSTPNIIEFENANGDTVRGSLELTVGSITDRLNTAVFVGITAAEFLRIKGWTIKVNN